MTDLSFGFPTTLDTGGGVAPAGSTPLLSYGASGGNSGGLGLDSLSFWTNPSNLDMGATAQPSQAGLALSGPLGGGGTPNVPSYSTTSAQQAAAAAADQSSGGYGATGFIYTLGKLAQSALGSGGNSTPPTLQPTPASYTPGAAGAATPGMSKVIEIGLILGAAFVALELVKHR